MSPFDAVNAGLEVSGGAIQLLNCRRLARDRQVRGVNPWVTAFFCSWGLWNLAFYPAVNAPLSALGAGLLVFANATWLLLAYMYRNN